MPGLLRCAGTIELSLRDDGGGDLAATGNGPGELRDGNDAIGGNPVIEIAARPRHAPEHPRGGRMLAPEPAPAAGTEADPLNDRKRPMLRLIAADLDAQLDRPQRTRCNSPSTAIGKPGAAKRIEARRPARQQDRLASAGMLRRRRYLPRTRCPRASALTMRRQRPDLQAPSVL